MGIGATLKGPSTTDTFPLPADLFTIYRPTGTTALPIVANLPHSGLKLPSAIAHQFTLAHRRSLPNSDWHLQPLYSFLPSLGITVMQANYSRYVVDLNRALKPPLFGTFWSAAIPEQTAFKQPIYRASKPTKTEVKARIDEFYRPYHHQLTNLLNETLCQHGKVYLLDLHSFMGLITDDVCLGNANGKTCSERLIDHAAESFTQQGYQTVKNKVFTGGYITRHYGEQPQVEALQIEIRYPVYLPDDQLPENPSPEHSQELGQNLPVSQQIPRWQGPKFSIAQARLKTVFEAITKSLIQT